MTTSRWLRCAFAVGVVFSALSLSLPVHAQVLESDVLQRKQEDQQRARTLTRELVGGVLDVQLRQLEENGLTDQEIYRDIKLMRQNLNHLIETEMAQVVELLAETQRLPKDKREASFVEARQQIRTIIRQLAVERRNLMKRLKIAELAEQVQRLIRQQTAVQLSTKRLPQEQQSRQETLTLKAIEDQRDVKELYLQLIELMVDMKSWNGLIAATAADGLRIVKAAEIPQHLDIASRNLQAVKFELAAEEQDQVIKGLMKLLTIIERTQGALNSERMAATDRIRALAEKQKQLRDETVKLPENQLPPASMVERQSQLQNEISRLQDLLRNNPKAEALIQQAETAALDAAASLLDNKRDEAQAQQNRVIANLGALEVSLKEPSSERARDKSADELAQLMQSLNQTKEKLIEAKQKQAEATATAQENAQAAAPTEKATSEIVKQTDDGTVRPAAVETALAEVREATDQTAKILESAAPEKATPIEAKAMEAAAKSIDRAINTVNAALVETQRLETAIKIGELARAAEVLERAAAEERNIAKEANSLAQASSSQPAETTPQAGALAERQQNLQAIAEKTAQAIAKTAPQASQQANEGAQQAAESGNELKKLVNDPPTEAHVAAKNAANAATNAAQKLSESAKQIRDEIVSSAKALADRSTVQADRLSESRKAVESAADRLPSNDPVAQLQAAKDKLNEAMQEQSKAQGKPDAAASMKLANQIASALDAQDSAMAAALAAESGIGSELKATALQEEVAEKSQAAAESAAKRPQASATKATSRPDAVTQALNDAQQAATQAAKQTLDGNPAAAQSSRKTAEESLKRALELARAEASDAAKAAPTGAPDSAAQAKAAAAATESQQMAAKASAQAGADLTPAAIAAEAANQAVAGKSDQAPAAQARSADAMRQAEKGLNAAIAKAAADQAHALADQSQLNSVLADHVAAVDPSAADAVGRAAEAARMGSRTADAPQQMTTAAKVAEAALENAVANLGAKEQEVHRDQAIAESIANLAREQQLAANRIQDHAAELEDHLTNMKDSDAPSSALQSTAQKLNDAQQQFADSQRATGQGAVELSGQTQVANPPLREALDLASNLPVSDMPLGFHPEGMLAERDAAAAKNLQDASDASDTPGEIAKDLAAADASEDAGDGQGKKASKQGNPTAAKPNGLGTGFIPQTPELTAEMMAGPKAQKEAQRALGRSPLPQGELADKSPKPRPTNQSNPQDEAGNELSNSSKLSQTAGKTTNQKVREGANEKQQEGTSSLKSDTGQSREAQESQQARQFKEEAWFAKLPPELRKSIRAGAGQKPPRAYEERLKKYFQSVE